jgi:hypothetical protein
MCLEEGWMERTRVLMCHVRRPGGMDWYYIQGLVGVLRMEEREGGGRTHSRGLRYKFSTLRCSKKVVRPTRL